MIFASDLDQTLIYSENFLNKYYSHPEHVKKELLFTIEYYQSKPLSYIHNHVIVSLRKIDNAGLFLPVTTRTIEQYKRIDFDQYGINPEFAVTTNGAKILRNGKVLKEWSVQVEEKLNKIQKSTVEIQKMASQILPKEVIKKERIAEDIFAYYVLYRENLEFQTVEDLTREAAPLGWEVSLQGTKIYLIPDVISKWDAVSYVCTMTKQKEVLGAGDSLLDLSLLNKADISIIPRHGEIFNQNKYDPNCFLIAEHKGVKASLSIVEMALSKCGLDNSPAD